MPALKWPLPSGKKSQVVGVLLTLPLVHNERVVDRDANDFVNAMLLESRR